MNWYLLQTKARQEYNVSLRLKDLRYESYLPLMLADKRYRSRITECMFPTYCFVSMEKGVDDFHPLTKIPGVLRLIKLTRNEQGYFEPTPVPDRLIERLKLMEDEMGINSSFKSDYAEGDRIRVKSGPMKDYEGVVKKLKAGLQGDQRALILIGALQFEVRTRELEPIA